MRESKAIKEICSVQTARRTKCALCRDNNLIACMYLEKINCECSLFSVMNMDMRKEKL